MKLQIVPAKQGVQWVKQGVSTFFKQPWALSGLFFIALVLVLIISAVPIVGGAVALMLLPAWSVGIMLASEQASAGNFPKPTVLFSALRQGWPQTRSVLWVGAAYFAGFLLILLCSAVVDGGAFLKLFLVGAPAAELSQLMQDGSFRTAMLLSAFLNAPVTLVFCYATALVYRHQLSAAKSVFFSTITFAKNYRALVVFGVTWLGTSIAIALGFSLLSAALGGSKELFGTLLFSTALLLDAMVLTSFYFTFRDCFETTLGEPL